MYYSFLLTFFPLSHQPPPPASDHQRFNKSWLQSLMTQAEVQYINIEEVFQAYVLILQGPNILWARKVDIVRAIYSISFRKCGPVNLRWFRVNITSQKTKENQRWFGRVNIKSLSWQTKPDGFLRRAYDNDGILHRLICEYLQHVQN